MTFQSLEQLLSTLAIIERAPEQKQFQLLLSCWPQVMGPRAVLTRPLALQGGVLKVATATPALSQELTFKAPRILQDLNARLDSPLNRIRFSAALWSPRQDVGSKGETLEHPSQIPATGESLHRITTPPSPTKDPLLAFQNWADSLRERSQHLPLCPQCQAPSPPGELVRWSVCALCATKQFS
jgi:predicted nucleic acid-binding Zn ribbon protein